VSVPPGLLVDIQRQIERIYALEPQSPVTDYLIPDEEACRLPGDGSRTLLRQVGDDVAMGVVIEAEVEAGLEGRDPRVRLDGTNLAPFCTLTEEISHFVYLMFCARSGRTVTRLELELQGEVDKYLTALFLLSVQNEGAVSARLRALLFQGWTLRDGLNTESAERYRAASGLGWRYTGWLERSFLRERRLAELAREARRFYRLGQREKLEQIAALA
jgi:hypothetical protein